MPLVVASLDWCSFLALRRWLGGQENAYVLMVGGLLEGCGRACAKTPFDDFSPLGACASLPMKFFVLGTRVAKVGACAG